MSFLGVPPVPATSSPAMAAPGSYGGVSFGAAFGPFGATSPALGSFVAPAQSTYAAPTYGAPTYAPSYRVPISGPVTASVTRTP